MSIRKTLVLLEYARFFSLILVIFEHISLLCPYNALTRFLMGGGEATLFFILLSGYISRYTDDSTHNHSFRSTMKYLHKYYLYFVVSILLIAIYQILVSVAQNYFSGSFVIEILQNVLLSCAIVPTWFSPDFVVFSGPGWYFEVFVFLKLLDTIVQKVFPRPKDNKTHLFILALLILILYKYERMPFMNTYLSYYFILPRTIQYYIGVELFHIIEIIKPKISAFISCLVILLFGVWHLNLFELRSYISMDLIVIVLFVILVCRSKTRDYTYPKWLRILRKHFFGIYIFHFIIAKYWYMIPAIGSSWTLLPLSLVTTFILDLCIEKFYNRFHKV